MKKTKKQEIIDAVPGWQTVELFANLHLPCAICKEKPRTMFYQMRKGDSYAVCRKDALAENERVKGK